MSMKRKKPKRISRKNPISVAALSAAATFMVCAVFILSNRPDANALANAEAEKTPATEETITLPVPSRPVALGEKLSDVPFINIPWPKNRFSEEYLKNEVQLKELYATSPLAKLTPIAKSSVTTEVLDRNAVVEGIPEGMRAITVKVDAESAVEGWAQSGNFVDVILLKSSKQSNIGLEALVIAENVRILSAGRSANPSGASASAPRTPSTVTLLTSQEEALKIKTASNIGKLTFALRGIGDKDPAQAVSLSQKSLLGENQSSNRPKDSFAGYAIGPDGKRYVLSSRGDRQWMKVKDDKQVSSPGITSEVESEASSKEVIQ